MDYYDIISKGYDELHKEEQLNKLKIIKKIIKIIPPLLDIGCGPGYSLKFFNVKPSYGIDSSKEMVKLAKNKNVILGKAECLPFPNKTFNTIISVTAIHNFDNIEKALKEMKRVSKNNNIAITVLKKSSKFNKIKSLIKKYFYVKELEIEKDIIFYPNLYSHPHS